MQFKQRYIIIFILSFFSSAILFAQQPLNFDFEKQSIGGYKQAWGWDLESSGQGTKILLDSVHQHNGKFSLHIESSQYVSADTAVASYPVEPYLFKGKKIRIEGWIKMENYSGRAFLVVGHTFRSGNN